MAQTTIKQSQKRDDMSHCRTYLSADQTVATSTNAVCHLDRELWDTLNEFNTSTYTFTATRAGKYIVSGTCGMNVGDGNRLIMYIYKNGAVTNGLVNSMFQVGNNACYAMSEGTFNLDANDTVTLIVSQESGVNKTLAIGNRPDSTRLCVDRIA